MELTKESLSSLKPKVREIDLSPWFEQAVTSYVTMIDTETVLKANEDAESDDKAKFVEWCANGLCDANGMRIFANGDAEALRKLPFKALEHIASEVMEFNGLTEGDAEKN